MRLNIFLLVCVILIIGAGFSSLLDHQGVALKLLTWGYYFLTAGVITKIIRS